MMTGKITMPLQEEINVILGSRKDCLKNNAWTKELFNRRVKFNTANYKEVEEYIFDYLKNTYDKELNNEIKISI